MLFWLLPAAASLALLINHRAKITQRRAAARRGRRRWSHHDEFGGHQSWTIEELRQVRRDVVASVGERHGTDGWPE